MVKNERIWFCNIKFFYLVTWKLPKRNISRGLNILFETIEKNMYEEGFFSVYFKYKKQNTGVIDLCQFAWLHAVLPHEIVGEWELSQPLHLEVRLLVLPVAWVGWGWRDLISCQQICWGGVQGCSTIIRDLEPGSEESSGSLYTLAKAEMVFSPASFWLRHIWMIGKPRPDRNRILLIM